MSHRLSHQGHSFTTTSSSPDFLFLLRDKPEKPEPVFYCNSEARYFNLVLETTAKNTLSTTLQLTLYNGSCILAFNLACPVFSPDTRIISPCFPTRSISDMYPGGVYVDSENLSTLEERKDTD